jgi:hypothetical protein
MSIVTYIENESKALTVSTTTNESIDPRVPLTGNESTELKVSMRRNESCGKRVPYT